MSTRRICDRCKKPVDSLVYRNWAKRFFKPTKECWSHFKLESGVVDVRYDLCPECNKDFSKFMEGHEVSDEMIHHA